MEGSYFIWKGINSLDKNIMVNQLPDYEIPQANTEKITIPGKDGFLTQTDGTYDGVTKSCECSLDNGYIDDISAWLNGSSNVVFSNEPDKIYKATIINKIPFSKIIPTFHSFIILFECQPHKYSNDNAIITLSLPGTILNCGSVNSNPIIKVYGTGDIVLNIGEQQFGLYDLDEYITIDCDMMDCYKDTEPKNSATQGEFPKLEIGLNDISWMGNVTKIEVTPNWKWL